MSTAAVSAFIVCRSGEEIVTTDGSQRQYYTACACACAGAAAAARRTRDLAVRRSVRRDTARGSADGSPGPGGVHRLAIEHQDLRDCSETCLYTCFDGSQVVYRILSTPTHTYCVFCYRAAQPFYPRTHAFRALLCHAPFTCLLDICTRA
jgi:hypothetical protein